MTERSNTPKPYQDIVNRGVMGQFALRCTIYASAPYFRVDTAEGLWDIRTGKENWDNGDPITDQDQRNFASADTILQLHDSWKLEMPTLFFPQVENQTQIYDKAQAMVDKTGIILSKKKTLDSYLLDINAPTQEVQAYTETVIAEVTDIWNARGKIPLEVFSEDDMNKTLRDFSEQPPTPDSVGTYKGYPEYGWKMPIPPTRIEQIPYYDTLRHTRQGEEWLNSVIEDITELDSRLKNK